MSGLVWSYHFHNFLQKISRKSLKLERPWQGLSQLFTLKFWFLNFKKILSKTKYKRIRTQPIQYCCSQLTPITVCWSVLSAGCHVRLVTASKLEWAAEHWAGETRPGPVWRTLSLRHRLSEHRTPTDDWISGEKENILHELLPRMEWWILELFL